MKKGIECSFEEAIQGIQGFVPGYTGVVFVDHFNSSTSIRPGGSGEYNRIAGTVVHPSIGSILGDGDSCNFYLDGAGEGLSGENIATGSCC